MNAWLALGLRAGHDAAALLLLGSVFAVWLPQAKDAPRIATWRRRWLSIAVVAGVAGLLLGFGVLIAQAFSVEAPGTLLQVAARLLIESRFGWIWLLRQALLALAVVALLAARRDPERLAPAAGAALCSAVALALLPFAGHSVAAQADDWLPLAHALHLLAAAAWWGALPALADLLRWAPAAVGTRTLQRFSAGALPLMALIVASGVALALVHVERWPALLGTRYGLTLFVKIGLLLLVLAIAARLRARLRAALKEAGQALRTPAAAAWVIAELALGAAIVVAAAQLAQSVPARHDAIDWWLPFRLSIDATWPLDETRWKLGGALAMLVGAVALALATLRTRAAHGAPGRLDRGGARAHRIERGAIARAQGLAAAVLAAGAVALGLHTVSVEAYPDTYRQPSVAYHAVSVAAGARLFAQHCVSCHGTSGHGDGAQAASLSLPPADLTEPHTALHTAGDIFWWLTHGKPPGAMPGFGVRLGEDDKWDLINYLRTLSAGYQARILAPQIVAQRPWLPAIDFDYVAQDGERAALKDLRGSQAALLVFFRLPQSRARLERLAYDRLRLAEAGVQVIGVPLAGEAPDGFPFALVRDDAGDVAGAYALLRRSLTHLDARDAAPLPAHMELLVDRFGYVRARWLPKEDQAWADNLVLVAQAARLQAEPQLRAPPEDHVH